MSILFQKSSTYKRKMKFDNGDIFESPEQNPQVELSDIFPQAKPILAVKRTKNKEKADFHKYINDITSFVRDNEAISTYVKIGKGKGRKGIDFETQNVLGNFPKVISTHLESIEKMRNKILNNMHSRRKNVSDKQRKMIFLYYHVQLKEIKIIKDQIQKMQAISKLLIDLISYYLSGEMNENIEINTEKLKIGVDIGYIKSTNKRIMNLNDFKEKIEKLIFIKVSSASTQKINEICRSLYNSQDTFFIDKGEAETLFYYLVKQMDNSFKQVIKDRIINSLRMPKNIGKNIYISAKELLDIFRLDFNNFIYYFILFSRYFFEKMFFKEFSKEMFYYRISTFANHVSILRKQSVIGFGFSQIFLPPILKSISLDSFPSENPYKEAINLFSQLPFCYCPLDFCDLVVKALTLVQNVAATICFQEKTKETSKILAKTDYLLCTDDLCDISLLIFLLSEPVATYPLFKIFQTFINGLELPSRMEFAFTSISIIFQQISEIKIEQFEQVAKERIENSLEIDPLLNQ